ncbi:hypothetical protein PCANC_27904 [Puccinia coronata f. sp. avenae]|uniref:HECT-type E3 ubiquitin transferase n=1 Tax=Puccinia coronata f. sp. avenae TaxID=200324 RepID=A0A2N5TIU5_9BASI|nr:hypothetical protein PCANC_27904 [Puccinia coronata f. sp. avenae]
MPEERGETRKWLTILVKQIPGNPDHIRFFPFCGKVIGRAWYNGRVVDAYFTLAFYTHLLDILVGLNDLESVNPDVRSQPTDTRKLSLGPIFPLPPTVLKPSYLPLGSLFPPRLGSHRMIINLSNVMPLQYLIPPSRVFK